MKAAVLSPYYPPAFLAGGPVKWVSLLVRAPGNPFETTVLSRSWDLGDRTQLRSGRDRSVYVGPETVWLRSPGVVAYVRCLWELRRSRADLVYVNSLFDPWMALVPALLWSAFGRPHATIVVAPRGQTGAEALSKSRYRKRPLLWAWRHLVRGRRVIWHAASDQEQKVRERRRRQASGRACQRCRSPPARIGVAAGFIASTRSFLGSSGSYQGAFAVADSPARGGGPALTRCLRPVRGSGLPGSLSRTGRRPAGQCSGWVQRPGCQRPSAVRLAQYDVMLNPTRGESFGQAIGESLSVGTPVAIADVTPWTPWIRRAAGVHIVHDDQLGIGSREDSHLRALAATATAARCAASLRRLVARGAREAAPVCDGGRRAGRTLKPVDVVAREVTVRVEHQRR